MIITPMFHSHISSCTFHFICQNISYIISTLERFQKILGMHYWYLWNIHFWSFLTHALIISLFYLRVIFIFVCEVVLRYIIWTLVMKYSKISSMLSVNFLWVFKYSIQYGNFPFLSVDLLFYWNFLFHVIKWLWMCRFDKSL